MSLTLFTSWIYAVLDLKFWPKDHIDPTIRGFAQKPLFLITKKRLIIQWWRFGFYLKVTR